MRARRRQARYKVPITTTTVVQRPYNCSLTSLVCSAVGNPVPTTDPTPSVGGGDRKSRFTARLRSHDRRVSRPCRGQHCYLYRSPARTGVTGGPRIPGTYARTTYTIHILHVCTSYVHRNLKTNLFPSYPGVYAVCF